MAGAIAELTGAAIATGEDALPLCVDLDGTLLRTDSLHEATAAVLLADPRVLTQIPGWLAQGRAHLKQQLAARWQFDPARLPYNQALLTWLRAEQARGRHIVLATAADRRVAEVVAAHLGLFDEVIASDGSANLRGAAKAAALVQRFGERGFAYAGNDATDHAVWRHAAAAVLVNAPAAVQREAAAGGHVARTIAEPRSVWRATLRALRPHQWVKNALCLIPPLAAGDLRNPHAWAATLAVAAAFCLVASGIYLFNDLADIAADRASVRKSRRPFASGALSPLVGLALAPPLLLAGGALGWRAGAAPALGAYLALSIGYNVRLKEMPLIDVFVLAALYTIRLFGGGEASGHAVSLWLLGFSSFLFLGLALVKRVSELQRVLAAGGRSIARRGYLAEDVLMLQMFGTAAAFASAIVLSLYVQSTAVMRLYAQPVMLWGSIPLLLFWQCRLWLATARGYMHDDPIVYAARDWVSWLVCLGLGGVVALAWAPVGW
ncbi:MAG: UbiA family prenyltransferase [Alphaproteobacteria bacterium]|nr:UbiA family prenyltransferase [Alphaproteobacteria bacterium]